MTLTVAPASKGEPEELAMMDIPRLMADLANTGVVATLISGFSLTTVRLYVPKDSLQMFIYLTSFIAVHVSTCAALSGIMFYYVLNGMQEHDASAWALKWRLVLKMPLLKAVMGAVSYLSSVILISWENLGASATFQVVAMVIGAMSVATVLCTSCLVIATTRGKIDYRKL
jgi:hypothetical protein|eukprot:CAMPEP_0174281070 /NCGR_PEP_ID=MMETSP0809-20121228/1402_1 /TAXON_ID=73025 ORGANISM="Eutreptiella gymnastica-like, Strain CCMP1594" /NCGR_SAMPLE_ID=MMETSP0809 /ASSEMBLY_ACC=CAM_ASM_000658 /LENGTH=170 /DNA_ID=CAMNT_0015374357 /DNA_START=34 /DNA_END=546 /DNA_ORIENTATION=+